MANAIEILAQVAQKNSQDILRQMAVYPAIAGVDMDAEEKQRQGAVVRFNRQFDVEATDVVPGNVAPAANSDIESYTVNIQLNKFKETYFRLNDKEWRELKKQHIVPATFKTRLKALVKAVEFDLQDQILLKIPNRVGTAGTAPTGISEINDAVTKMNTNGASRDRWAMAVDSDYAGILRMNSNILNSEISGTTLALRVGFIGPIFNFEVLESPYMALNSNLRITTGTHSVNPAVNNGSGYSKGQISIAIDGGTGTAVKGETIKFAGHDQRYVVQSNIGNLSSATLEIFPPLKEDVADDEAISFDEAASTALRVYGFGAARECLALVTRPWDNGDSEEMGASDEISFIQDEETGLVFRLVKLREHKQTRISMDILYGVGVVEPNNGVLVLG